MGKYTLTISAGKAAEIYCRRVLKMSETQIEDRLDEWQQDGAYNFVIDENGQDDKSEEVESLL